MTIRKFHIKVYSKNAKTIYNMIMIGPPGAGKIMVAKLMPTILPPFSLREALETTKIHSVVCDTFQVASWWYLIIWTN